jgi:hypothetical protein
VKYSLSGRQVLYIAPRFFDYDKDIAAELERRGARVDRLMDRPFDTPFMTAVTRFRREWMIHAADRLYRREIERYGRSSYDLVLVINGQTLSREILSELKAEFPSARFVLYMWDSIANRRSILESLDLFDSCFSFDPSAVQTHGFRLRPLFFSKGFESPPSEDFDYHISFIGTAHTDRRAILSGVDAALGPEIRRFWYLYLQARWVLAAYRLTNPAFRSARAREFKYVPLSRNEVQDVFRRSKAILDIEHPRQSGLTIRTFEALGASKKLVTTNSGITEYDFYDPTNICVLPRTGRGIPSHFLHEPYKPMSAALYFKYSLSGWLDEILSA